MTCTCSSLTPKGPHILIAWTAIRGAHCIVVVIVYRTGTIKFDLAENVQLCTCNLEIAAQEMDATFRFLLGSKLQIL